MDTADDPGSGADGSVDAVVAELIERGRDRPESRLLDPLVGRWAAVTEWEPVVGRGVRTSETTVEVRWVLGGRALAVTSVDGGIEVSRLLIAFDPSRGDYAAFGASVVSTHFEVERGSFDEQRQALVLEGEEPGPEPGSVLRYRRTVRIVSDREFTIDTSFPEAPGTYGPMRITHRRLP